jgi:hypothetical protein
MTEYETGDTFRDPSTGLYWQITGISPVYEVTIRPEGDDYDEDDVEISRFPEESLDSKREWGDLEPVEFVGEGTDEDEAEEEGSTETAQDGDEGGGDEGPTYPCPECGKVLQTERGRSSHVSQVHGSEDDTE